MSENDKQHKDSISAIVNSSGESLLIGYTSLIVVMSQHITETEMERIVEFAKTPAFRRDPEQLVPDS